MATGIPIRRLAALLAALIACRAPAELAAKSPFLAAGASPDAAAQGGPSGPIELRGIMATPGGYAYCIYETAKKKDEWIGLNEPGHDFVVRSADPAKDSIRVDYQGRSINLTLKVAKVASSGPASAMMPTPGALPGLVNAAADEQRRLDQVAQEVRRRRLEREKALQAAQQGLTPPPSGR